MGLSARMTVDRIELHNPTPSSPLAMIGLGLNHPGSTGPVSLATLHASSADGSHAHLAIADPNTLTEYTPGTNLVFTAQPDTQGGNAPKLPPDATEISGTTAEPQVISAGPAGLGGLSG